MYLFIHITQIGGFIKNVDTLPTKLKATADSLLKKTKDEAIGADQKDGNIYYTSMIYIEEGMEITIKETKHTLLVRKL